MEATAEAIQQEWGPLVVPDSPIERYLNTLVNHTKSTLRTYRSYLQHLEAILGNPLDLATLDELCSALNQFSTRYSPNSYAICKSALRGFLSYIGKPDYTKLIKNTPKRWSPRRGPTPEQIDALLEVADFRERALILVLYSTGLRIGELLNTRVDDIDWERGLIRVTGKGGSSEGAPFFIRREQAMRVLRLWLNGRASGPIFDISRNCVWIRLNELGRRVGIKLTPHLLRHSTARSMRRSGADIFEVSAQLRHRNIDNTLAYERAEPHDLIVRAREREWR